MNERHVVVGAGPVGLATAELLVEQGKDVVLVSRSGIGPEIARQEFGAFRREAADAADAGRLVELAQGAVAIYNCVNPPSYTVWPEFWPPVAAAFLEAAERSGALLVTAAALYPYGPVDGGHMVEGLPDAATTKKALIRGRMWAEAKLRHDAGQIKAVEVRGSDYMGPRVSTVDGSRRPRGAGGPAGKTVRVMGRPTTALVHRRRATWRAPWCGGRRTLPWGRVWHAPTNPAKTQAEVIADVCRAVGREPGKVKPMPGFVLGVLGAVVPILRELRETEYQFAAPYVLDSSEIEERYGLAPTPWTEVCRATAENALLAS